jgi:hypothetical protein
MKGEGEIIIRITNTRGASIKIAISKTDKCTRGINKIGEKSCPGDLRVQTLAER